MPMSMSVLGSGSSGNSTLLVLEEETSPCYLLIDAGLSPKDLTQRLAKHNITPDMLSGILVTHLHRDHFRDNWLKTAKANNIPIYLHNQHTKLWSELGRSIRDVELMDASFVLAQNTQVQTISLPHDQQGSVGFVFEHDNIRLGFATDLGHVPKAMLREFHDLDALAIESNYDTDLQRRSRRPAYLKKRVMGRLGHLSNEQAWEAVVHIAKQSLLQRIFFLHRSQQCNTISIMEEIYQSRNPELVDKLIFTDPIKPTPLVPIQKPPPNSRNFPKDQLNLF